MYNVCDGLIKGYFYGIYYCVLKGNWEKRVYNFF